MFLFPVLPPNKIKPFPSGERSDRFQKSMTIFAF